MSVESVTQAVSNLALAFGDDDADPAAMVSFLESQLLTVSERLMMHINSALTHYHTMLHFDTLKIYSCRKYCDQRRNCL